jgi:hypothetical protein
MSRAALEREEPIASSMHIPQLTPQPPVPVYYDPSTHVYNPAMYAANQTAQGTTSSGAAVDPAHPQYANPAMYMQPIDPSAYYAMQQNYALVMQAHMYSAMQQQPVSAEAAEVNLFIIIDFIYKQRKRLRRKN